MIQYYDFSQAEKVGLDDEECVVKSQAQRNTGDAHIPKKCVKLNNNILQYLQMSQYTL